MLFRSRQLLRSYGFPPRLTGSISSTSGDSGKPCLSLTSTNPPQSQQFVSSLSTCALSLFLFVLLVLRGSLTSSPSVRGELCLLLCCTSLCAVCVLLVQCVCGVWAELCDCGGVGVGVGVIPCPCPGRRSGGVVLVVHPCPRLSRRTPGCVAGGVRPGRGIVALGSQLVGTLLSASCPGATSDSARSSSAMRAM